VKIIEEKVGKVTVIAADGRMDSTNSPKLQDHVAAVLTADASSVLLDLGKVDYISSAGFRSLLILAKQSRQSNRPFVLCGLTPKVKQLFDLGGFLELLPITATREEGIAAAQ
jgi:stage II sporulation protein AA (anti-sigma F factor antagonist)